MIIALAGGVGGARLAHGLAALLPPEELVIVVNTGDDFEHMGLHISPDPDTVTYTLAGIADRERGWGLADETWNFMGALARLGGEAWFLLGDKDLGTHIERTRRLKAGETLSEVTRGFAHKLGIAHAIVPMTDDPVRTMVHTDAGILTFQDYFVRQQCAPVVTRIQITGGESAKPSPAFLAAMQTPALSGIVICPSNPLLSIDPILAVSGVRKLLRDRPIPAVAVSPIIGGKAVKGPAAKMMRELGMPVSAAGVADHYTGLIDGLIVDHVDANQIATSSGLAIHATDALMRDEADRARLARETLQFLSTLRYA